MFLAPTAKVDDALRFARAFTGREKILRFEGHYHGWSDAIHWSAHPALEQAMHRLLSIRFMRPSLAPSQAAVCSTPIRMQDL